MLVIKLNCWFKLVVVDIAYLHNVFKLVLYYIVAIIKYLINNKIRVVCWLIKGVVESKYISWA